MTLKKADETHLNEKLTQARLERAWSQTYVADHIGTTFVSVSRWERGIAFPDPYFRKKLCQLYGKNEEELGLVKKKTKNKKEPSHREAQGELEQPTHDLWNVPYTQSPFFTGRASILQDIHDKLSAQTAKISTLAISGLGGIGKTLTAIEYAYQYQGDYSTVLWANAENYQTLASDFEKMADEDMLNLSIRHEQDQGLIITAVKRWLSTHHNWLLILDNVEDLTEVDAFLPRTGHGSVLLTTRDQTSGDIVDYQIQLEKMEPEDAATFLLRRTRKLPKEASLSRVNALDQREAKTIADVLDYLPLALEQAGAYIDETKCSFSEYLELYEKQHKVLLRRRSRLAIRYRETVATTWSISFQRVERVNPISADLLRYFAFLHATAIPEEIFTTCSQDLGPLIGQIDTMLVFHQAIEELFKYSLVKRNANDRTINIHRLVQTVLRDELNEEQQRVWIERTICAISRIFPSSNVALLRLCERYFLHAHVCATFITQCNVMSKEAASLLYRAGTHALARSQHLQAQQLLHQALAIYDGIREYNTIEVADCLKNLAVVYELQGNFAEAEDLHLKAETLYEQLLGYDDLKVIETLNSLALLYIKQQKMQKAEKALERISTITRERQEIDAKTCIDNLHIQAQYHLAKGQFAEAEPLFFQALSQHKQLRGQDHPSQISILNGIVTLYMNQGRFLEAEPICRQIVTIVQKEFVPQHDIIACHLSNLATISKKQGKFTQAEEMYQRARKIWEETRGSESSEIVSILNNLGLLYRQQGRLAEAEEYYQKTLAVADKVYEGEHPNIAYCLTNLAFLYQQQGKYDVIESLLQRALTVFSSTFGPDHPEMVYGLNNLAAFYSSQGRYTQAETFYRQAVILMERTQVIHQMREQVLQGYAYVLRETGREDEARAMEARVFG